MSLGIVSIDAASVCGYSVILDGEVLLIGQCPLADLGHHIGLGFFSGPEWVLCVEKPFIGSKQSPISAINNAENCGWALAVTQQCFPEYAAIWRPLATTWRALIPDMPQSPAQLCKSYAVQIALAAGLQVIGPKGAYLVDAAEAYVMGLACGYWWNHGKT